MQCVLEGFGGPGHFHHMWSPIMYPIYTSKFSFVLCLRPLPMSLNKMTLTPWEGTEDASKILSNDGACPICDQVLSKR